MSKKQKHPEENDLSAFSIGDFRVYLGYNQICVTKMQNVLCRCEEIETAKAIASALYLLGSNPAMVKVYPKVLKSSETPA